MKIYLASDHGGYYLKEEIKNYLKNQGHDVSDFGNTIFDPNDDYTSFVLPLAQKVAKDKRTLGVIFGRSGNGEVIATNKVKDIRAALCLSEKMARRAREHNNANILSLGAEYISPTSAKKIVTAFLKTSFSSAIRHKRRVKAISAYESSHS